MRCTWFDSGYMFFEGLWKNLHIFHVAVNSHPEAFGLLSCRMENRAQSMLLVVASLSAVRTLEVEHYFHERSFLTGASICRALDDEEFFVIERSTQISSRTRCIADVM